MARSAEWILPFLVRFSQKKWFNFWYFLLNLRVVFGTIRVEPIGAF